jgi:hypothetical protein
MKNTLAPGIPLVIVLAAAVATVALRAAAMRQQPRWLPGTEPGPPGSPGRPPGTVEQMQYVFHELHPAGRNALCAVCDAQYRSAERMSASAATGSSALLGAVS